MIELLPCPFCGGEARLTVHEGYHRASCFTCGNGTRAYADRHEAVRRWSRRVETAEDSSGVRSVSEKETVGKEQAMSDCKHENVYCEDCGENIGEALRGKLSKAEQERDALERQLQAAAILLSGEKRWFAL